MKGAVIWSDSWLDVEAERASIRVQLDDWERSGFPEVPKELGYSWVAGLYSFANGGDFNHRGRRSLLKEK